VQVQIKAELGGKASAPLVSKRASELWKATTTEERQHWDNEAMKEKERYMAEKADYTGPWQVPHKRAKKDPSAPKRNPSAFLLFTQGKRQEIKNLNPGTKNTEISRILGQLLHTMPEEKKRPHIEREIVERERYKTAMAEWRRQQEMILLTGKVDGTASTPPSNGDGDAGRKVPPVSLEDVAGSRMQGSCGDDYNTHSYTSKNRGASQSDYGANMYPPRTMWYSQQQCNGQPHMYRQRPPQEQYRNGDTQDIYSPRPGGYHSRHEQQQHRYSRSQHGKNSANDTDFDPIPFFNRHGPPQGRSQMEQRDDYDSCLPLPNDDEHHQPTNMMRGNEVEHRQHHCQQEHNEHTVESNITRGMSFEEYDTIEQQRVRDKPKQEDSNLDSHRLYHQQQRQYAQDNMIVSNINQDQRHHYHQDNIKQQDSDLDAHVYNHQQNHRYDAMDKYIRHNRLSEQLNGTQ